ncbi:OmpA family protein [Rubrivivax gelatinosus]|uniref:Outer membrane protein OmpA-like peptidoglycan-associated protein n=1 Tax=Rubrivivax gelatinosus TaxID=28068 RepID=A0A4R2M9V2_RUBGE|nr:OmpA family protein [Rubrivivax gelatinosus]MBK1687925.1 flagellar motor protein MotB [Rubrivivax gelatinosus]TCP01775.1 outer membrane protein OmpA-like peptidoglycan-associated protein [Rubrivivax gelatinosus]
MTTLRHFTLAVLAAAALGACSTQPTTTPALDQARSDYRSLQGDAQTQRLAPLEAKQAGDALAQAEAAQARRDDAAQVEQLSYLAKQRIALAREAGRRKASEEAVAGAAAERDQQRLAARTREADVSAQAAAVAQRQAGDAERRNAQLRTQLSELEARKTERGLVLTLDDVLFDSGRAELRAGGLRKLQQLGDVLRQEPQRRASIEGYTDSTGSESGNLSLSRRRADAVLGALLDLGVNRAQLTAQGYGASQPVAANDSADGRQMNRRVEIVLSDENGMPTLR